MAEGTYKLIKENSEGTYDEKEVQAESGKALGFDSGLDPVMVDPGTSGDSVTDVFVEQDPQFPIEYLKYTKDGVDYDVTAIAKANGLIWGGFVSWVELLIFSVTPSLYYLFAVLYKILETTIITLDAADPDNPRIDVIAVDNTSSVIVIKGTPAANPQKPSIDPETQIELTYVLIPAGATEPENIDQSIIYDENTEWTGAGSGVTVDFDNATSPFHLSKCASVGSIDKNDTVTFTTGVPVDVTDFKNLILYLKLKATMSSRHNLYAAWMRSGVMVSNEVVLAISKSNVTTWQSIAIQLTSFTWSQSTVDTLRLRWSKSGPNVAHDGFYLDFVKLETGIIQQVVNSAIILTGDITGSGITGSPVPTTLATVNSNVGQFGDATNVPKVTVDGKGRVTAIENVAITIPPAITPTSDALPVDTDEVVSLRGTSWLKTTWTVLKAFLKTYFDEVYSAINHAHTFLSLTDTPAAYTGMAGKVAKVNVGENAIEFGDPGAGATTFLALTDTPAAYTGQAGKYPKVNVGENALEWGDGASGDFANKALSNLASVAINTSLISDTDSTDDLGSSAKYWANLYVDTIYTPAINGGAAANDDITIQGTTHAERTGSYVNLQPNGGLVGIGLAVPDSRLTINGTNSTSIPTLRLVESNSGKPVWMRVNQSNLSSSFELGVAAAAGQFFTNSIAGDAIFKAYGSGAKGIAFGSGETVAITMYIKPGFVGIGTTNPTEKLTILGSVNAPAFRIYEATATNPVWMRMENTGQTMAFELGISGGTGHFFTDAIKGDAIFKAYGSGAKGICLGSQPGSATTTTLYIKTGGIIGIGTVSPTARVHIAAGSATAGMAPLKFTTGNLLGTPEDGAFEFKDDNIHITICSTHLRKGIVLDDGARLTSGKIPIATTNGRLVDGQTPLAGTKVYYVSDSSEGAATRKLTFINGILTAET